MNFSIGSLCRSICILAMSLQYQTGIVVIQNDAVPDFPEAITFQLKVESDVQIESVEIEFAIDALKCGESVEKAKPEDFSPGSSIEVEWKLNFRRIGPVPPGTKVWWRWRISDSNGNTLLTPEQELLYTDVSFVWRLREEGPLSIYWYSGSRAFGEHLVDSGIESLDRLQSTTGIETSRKIQIFVYENSTDMQAASLFAPDWSGGLAFPDHAAVLLAVHPSKLEWGERVLAHELSHVVIGTYTFSCINSMPIWVDEGLAMHAEGEMRPYHAALLAEAIDENSLLSVRELGEIFSDSPELASLAYAQSFSLMDYILHTYEFGQILQMLDAFQDGLPEDRILMNVFGFDRDGLEAAWRDWVGAQPMTVTEAVGPTQTPTLYPTLVPIVGPKVQTTTPSQLSPSPSVSSETLMITPTPTSNLTDASSNLLAILGLLGLASLILIMFVWNRRRRSIHIK